MAREVTQPLTAVPALTPLQRQRRQVTVDALIEAAHRGMVEHGLDVSMDDIAELAQVSRRTVFRYFATREDLLSAAIDATSAKALSGLPRYDGRDRGGDWQAWLAEFAREVHRLTMPGGRLYWELATRRLPERINQAHARHREARHRLYGVVATTVWQAAGGGRATPRLLRQTVAAQLSPMFTQAVVLDAGGTPELAADMATSAITATVRLLLER